MELFPHANVAAGILVLIVGFGFHFVGQLISLLDWDLAMRLGLQEKDAPPEFQVYERGTAAADVAIGWIYGIAGVGLILGHPWGYKLAWIPGAVLVYHSFGAWFLFGNQTRAGYPLFTNRFRLLWCGANLVTGLLAVAVAWKGI